MKIISQNTIELYHPADPADPSSIMESKEAVRAIEQAIACLPPKRREAFQLAKLDDLSYSEIAKIMGISIRTVYKHIAKAVEKLRESIK